MTFGGEWRRWLLDGFAAVRKGVLSMLWDFLQNKMEGPRLPFKAAHFDNL